MPKNIVTKLLVCLDHQSKGYVVYYRIKQATTLESANV